MRSVRLVSIAIVAALVLAAPLAHAASLDAVRKSLTDLHATTPIEASLDVQSNSEDEDQKKSTKASVIVEHRGDDFRLRYATADLLRAAHLDAADRDLAKVDPEHAFSLIDFAPTLLHELEGATLTQQLPAAWKGKSATKAIFKLAAPHGPDAKYIKSAEMILSLYLGSDGIPVGAERHDVIKGRFLLIGFESTKQSTWDLEHTGDRLIVLREETAEQGSVIGRGSKGKTTTIVTPHV